MKKLKFKHNSPTIWVMNKQIFEDFKKYLHNLEHNTDTSAGHPVKGDDIVRYSFEKRRVKDKEPICNK